MCNSRNVACHSICAARTRQNGREFLARLCSLKPDIPVVVALHGFVRRGWSLRPVHPSVDNFPVNVYEIKEAVRGAGRSPPLWPLKRPHPQAPRHPRFFGWYYIFRSHIV